MWRKCLTDAALGALCALAAAAAGCRQDMHDQAKIEPLEASPWSADGRGSRKPVEGTVARGQLNADRVLHQGRAPTPSEDDLVDYMPFPATHEVLARGRERYDIFCSPCHARTGEGDGMVVRRGFRSPPSLHSERVRTARLGHLYDVITRGFGAMPAYAAQIPTRDRWAIVAYVRALQLSQHATIEDLPPEERDRLTGGAQ
jgi:mono/diheme cytochrome c family protein